MILAMSPETSSKMAAIIYIESFWCLRLCFRVEESNKTTYTNIGSVLYCEFGKKPKMAAGKYHFMIVLLTLYKVY